MKRIVHIVSRWLPRSETFTYELIRKVPGFEHFVLTTTRENGDLFPFQNLVVAASEEDYASHLARIGASLVVGHFGPSGFGALAPGMAAGVPVTTIFHGYDVSMLLRDPAWVERYQALFRFGAHAICISELGRQRLLDIGCPAARATTVHLGVDLSRFSFAPRRNRRPGDPLSLLIVARLAEKKGIPVALMALRHAIDRDVDVRLRIVGDGEDRDTLVELCARLGLERHVKFVGPVSSEGVRRELAACDALMLTSVTAVNGDQEGIPVVLMEAMASGVPVIASRHSAIPELIVHGESGLLAPEGDVERTASAIVSLANNPACGRRLAAAARDRVEDRFNLDRQGARFAALFRKVIAEHAASRVEAPAGDAAQRMLLVRSVPVSVALSKLVVLRNRYPRAELWVLTREDSREVFEQCPLVSKVVTVPPGRMSLATMPPATLASLREARLARVLVPIDRDPNGYDNVLNVAAACGARDLRRLTPSNEEIFA